MKRKRHHSNTNRTFLIILVVLVLSSFFTMLLYKAIFEFDIVGKASKFKPSKWKVLSGGSSKANTGVAVASPKSGVATPKVGVVSTNTQENTTVKVDIKAGVGTLNDIPESSKKGTSPCTDSSSNVECYIEVQLNGNSNYRIDATTTNEKWVVSSIKVYRWLVDSYILYNTYYCSKRNSCTFIFKTLNWRQTNYYKAVAVVNKKDSFTSPESVLDCTSADWICYEWSYCDRFGAQSRTCIKNRECIGDSGKPLEKQECIASRGMGTSTSGSRGGGSG